MTEKEVETGGLRGDVLIVFQTVITPITFIITYLIATSNNHVERSFPYISDTGTWPPESCIFGILLCFYSVSSFLTVYIRWHLIHKHSPSTASPRLNNWSLGLGIIASFGVLVVANFQETSQIVVHIIGAMMAFYVGTVYMWLQTVISRRTPEVPGFIRQVLSIRLVLAILTTISAITILPFAQAALSEYRGNETKSSSKPGSGKWDENLGGYDLHVASTSFEWALACLVSLYFLTFVREFRHIRVGMPKILVTQSDNRVEKSGGIDNPIATIE